MLKHKSLPVALCSFAIIIFIAFAIFYGKNELQYIQKNVNEHSQIVKKSLWNFNRDMHIEYLHAVAKQYGYQNIKILSDNNDVFFELNSPAKNQFESFLMSIKLIPTIKYSSDIIYKQQKIGSLHVVWRCNLIYTYSYALAILILILLVLRLYCSLEDRVRERTSELQRSEKRFRSLIDQAADAVFVVDFDGHIQMVNQRACDKLNYTQRELTNMSIVDISSGNLDVLKKMWQELKVGQTQIVEGIHTRSDGSTFPVEVSVGLFDRDGNKSILALARDISERKKIDQAYREIFNATNECIFLHDEKTGKILDVNQATLDTYGYTYDELLKLPLGALSSNNGSYTHEEALKLISKSVESGPQLFEWESKHKDGTIFWAEVALSSSEIGGKGRVLAVCRNITQSKKLEEELRESQKIEAVGTLAGGIAHDFNNILSAIQGYNEMAMMNIHNSEELARDLDAVKRSANRAKELVKQILTFSRKSKDDKLNLKLSTIVVEALKLVRSTIPTNIEIKQKMNSKSLIYANPTQIHQIVMNLCTNSYHAMRATGGTLTVSLNNTEIHAENKTMVSIPDGQYIVLQVSDTGHGMDQATKEKIFEPYYTTKEIGDGTGLGLAVVHGIVKSCDGHIEVNSTPEEGTVFNIYFPIVRSDEVEKTFDEKRDTPKGGTEKIMVIDDEPMIVDVLQRRLSSEGYTVSAYIDSNKALDAFKECPDKYDLIITDMAMPNMTGKKLAHKMISIKPSIPIIMCTGFSDEINNNTALKMGIKAFTHKPVKPNYLLELIRKVLDNEN